MTRNLIGFSDFDAILDEVGLALTSSPKNAASASLQSALSKGAMTGAPTVKTSGTAKGVEPTAGNKKGQPPKINTFPPPAKTTGMKSHGVVLQKAKTTITNGVQTLSKAAQALKAPAAKSAMAAVKKTLIGAAAAAKAGTLSPKAQLALKNQSAAVKKAAASRKALQDHVAKAHGTISELAKHAVNQKKTSVQLRTPPKRRTGTKVGELLFDPVIGNDVGEALLGYYDMVGADPDPSNPGYLTDGTPDPAFWGTDTTATDPTSGIDTSTLTEDPVDSGQDFPPAPPRDQFFTAAQAQAAGAIYYNGEKGFPAGYAGSYNLFTRKTDSSAGVPKTAGIDPTDHFGYIWGKAWDQNTPLGLPFGNDDLASDQWNGLAGRHILTDRSWAKVTTPDDVRQHNTAATNPSNPEGVKYGPIVGNPNMPDFAAMRFDDQLQPFYLPQEAPDWLLFPLKQAAALTAQANAKAAADAAAAQQAQMAQIQNDAAVAQAQQDAQNALAESQAQTQYDVDTASQSSQAQAMALQQAQLQQQQQQMEQQWSQQAAPLMFQQAQQQQAQQQAEWQQEQQLASMQMQYLQQHPEMLFDQASSTPPPDYAETMPGFEGQGGAGYYDDGTPMPGGDLMADEDGEGFADQGEELEQMSEDY